MALPSKYGIDKKINSMEGLSAFENGGKGSGNFGHSGRPGEVGGSGDGGLTEDVGKKTEVLVDVSDEYGNKVKEYMGSSEYKAKYEKLQEAISKEKAAESVMIEAKEKLAEMKSKLKSDSDGKMSAKALDEYSAYQKEKLAKTSDFNRAKAERKSAEQGIADGFKDAVLKGEKKGLEIEASIGKISGSKDLLITLRKRNSSEDTVKTLNGGKGSGNFGHVGRPGLIGGSGGGDAPAGEWDEPYKSFTKTDQIGVGDYGEAGFFTTGNFAVDAHLGAKDVVDSVKDYNIINDMLFEAETKDHLASTPEGIQVERLITDLKGELHAQNVYSSATFETSEIRQKILLQTAASASSIRSKLESARGVDSHNKYIDKAIDIAKKVERRASTAAKKSYDKWETHKTAKPPVAGGSASSDRPMTHAYDNYKVEKQRKRASDLAYMFSR